MRVFMTGATGYVGGAIAEELIRQGHTVTGLARTEAKAQALERAGVEPVRGDLSEPRAWGGTLPEHDAVILAAFDYGPNGVAADQGAIDAVRAAVKAGGRIRSVVFTSGVWVLGNTGDAPADEDASTDRAIPMVAWRPAHERAVLAAESPEVAAAVIRPGMVYGGKAGSFAAFFAGAEKEGTVTYVGDGRNRWSVVHREDAAALYRRVVEERGRGVFHAVDGVPIRVAEIAGAVAGAAAAAPGGKAGTRSVPVEEARKQMGPLADALCLDQVVVARRSAELGWKPARASFVQNVKKAYEQWRSS